MEIPPIRIGMTPDDVRDVAGAPDEAKDMATMLRENVEAAVASGRVSAADVPPDPGEDGSVPDAAIWTYRDTPEPGNVLMLTFKDGRVMVVSYCLDDG